MTALETATRPAPTAGDHRRRLLDGLAEAIRERGYREVTVADVVRLARTSRRTFYQHFDGLDDCYACLFRETDDALVAAVADAVDPSAPWREQVRQAVEGWIAAAQHDPPLALSGIRDIPALGEQGRALQRESLESFVVLLQSLASGPAFTRDGVAPPSRTVAVLLLGGLRELIATTVEDGGDIASFADEAVATVVAVLQGPTG